MVRSYATARGRTTTVRRSLVAGKPVQPDLSCRAAPGQRCALRGIDSQSLQLPDLGVFAFELLQAQMPVYAGNAEPMKSERNAAPECFEHGLFCCPQFQEGNAALHCRQARQSGCFVCTEIAFGNFERAWSWADLFQIDAGNEMPANGDQGVVTAV